MNKDINQISDKFIAYLRSELKEPTIGYESPLTRLEGGHETAIFGFSLKGALEELSKPLALRLYPAYYGPGNAVWESTIQNVLAGEGYPVPQVYFTCKDMTILGGAFIVMDFLPGKPMITAPVETIPELLGVTHAALHGIDPDPLIAELRERGLDVNNLGLSNQSDWLKEKGNEYPWFREGTEWLITNRPPEPVHPVLCHGDFHPLNILIQDGKVTGVLDWPGFHIADAVMDVANTVVLTTMPFKHLAESLDQDFSSVDWEMAAKLYLDAYRSKRPLDSTHLDYYKVRRTAPI
jgi:aminoglycoside phosphotransferase (APT) family kinase protein